MSISSPKRRIQRQAKSLAVATAHNADDMLEFGVIIPAGPVWAMWKAASDANHGRNLDDRDARQADMFVLQGIGAGCGQRKIRRSHGSQ